jgi:hypothetical protein
MVLLNAMLQVMVRRARRWRRSSPCWPARGAAPRCWPPKRWRQRRRRRLQTRRQPALSWRPECWETRWVSRAQRQQPLPETAVGSLQLAAECKLSAEHAGGSTLLAAAASNPGCCTAVDRCCSSSGEQQQPGSCITARQVDIRIYPVAPSCPFAPTLLLPCCPFNTPHSGDTGADVRRPLWEPHVLLAEARERVAWHEAMDSGAAPSDRQQVWTFWTVHHCLHSRPTDLTYRLLYAAEAHGV